MSKIVSKYDKLTTDEEERVSKTYYHVSLSLMKARPEHALVSDLRKAAPPKND